MAKSDSLFAIGVDLYKVNKYKEAIPFFVESDKIDKTILDSMCNRRNYSAMWLASCYYHLGDEIKAASIYNDYKEVPVDRRQTIKSDSLAAIGDMYYSNGDYKNALPYFIQCAEIEKEVVGEYHSFYKNSLIVIAYCHFFTGNSIEGKAVFEHIRCIYENQYGKKHQNYALWLDYLAKAYNNFNEYEEATRFETEAVQILRLLLKEDNSNMGYKLNYATMLYNLSVYLVMKENYVEALENTEISLSLREKLYGRNCEEYLSVLELAMDINSNLNNPICYEQRKQIMELSKVIYGKESLEYVERAQEYYMIVTYNQEHNYSKAIEGLEECVQIMEKLDGKDINKEKAFAIDNLALVYLAGSDYENAIKYYKKELDILGTMSNIEQKQKVEIIQNLSRCYTSISKYSEADSLLQLAYQLETETNGENTSTNETTFGLIAQNYFHQSEYNNAIKYTKIALGIHEKLFGCDIRYAKLLCELSDIYNSLYNEDEMIAQLNKASEIIHNTQLDSLSNTQKLEYAAVTLSIGNYHISVGAIDIAEPYIKQAVEIYSKGYKVMAKSYAHALEALASIQNKKGNREQTLETIGKAVDILYNDGINEKTTSFASALSKYAYQLASCGYPNEAVNVYLNANSIFKELLGDESEECMNMSAKLASIYYGLKDYARAGSHAVRLMKFLPNIVRTQFTTMTSTERTLFWKKYQFEFEDLIPRISYENQHPEVLKAAYNCCLFNKGMLLNTEQEMRKILLESGDSKVVALYDSISTTKRLLDESLKLSENQRIYPISVLKEKINMQEKELLSMSKSYGDFTKNMTITWEDVQKKLGDRDIAVEFLYFPMQKDTMGYSALILKKSYEYPRYVPCVGILPGSSLNKKERNTYGDTWMTNAIWRRMYDELQDVDNIYFAPTGELHNIAIESLLDLENPTMRMSERWNFYRLSSTRELAMSKDQKSIKTAAVYGGLKYNTDTTTMINNQKKYPQRDIDYLTLNISDSLTLRSGVDELPATEHEAKSIDVKLKERKIADSLYIGTEGTEASLKALSGRGNGLLHIATHGFYWTEKEARALEKLSFLEFDDNIHRPIEDKALTRSGLLFSGANNALTGKILPKEVDDGILTAKEISALDLRGLELVVLSACQTGLGEITGEGVFGLQRGFKKAGANSLLMSLWKVNDDATQLLMTQFYTNLMLGKHKIEALRDAQRYVREYEIEKDISKDDNKRPLTAHAREQKKKQEKVTVKIKPYQNPIYWAAFILLDAID